MTAPLRRLRRHPVLIVLATAIFVLLAPFQAQAAFQVSTAAATTVSSGTLAPASSPTTTPNCGSILGSQAYIVVGWTATSSTNIDFKPSPAGAYTLGYSITPVLNGNAQTPVTVSGRTTVSAQIAVTRNTLFTTNSYVFRVQATYGSWTSSTVTTSPAVSCPVL
ncbi:hypothetical protein KIH74_01680 [Kineosporia sp. J2-2]|uniref:Fibronectin type-III domain-containing protein n=1 Tax=Kineosporia corallincola TaxID=2835133 RepID=A0ABS5T964_9ACTN|nr:hypothetical protein [Kineosporia corallincola]MBT0767615.1 hypothetical protein [Kineosporia corallincola]